MIDVRIIVLDENTTRPDNIRVEMPPLPPDWQNYALYEAPPSSSPLPQAVSPLSAIRAAERPISRVGEDIRLWDNALANNAEFQQYMLQELPWARFTLQTGLPHQGTFFLPSRLPNHPFGLAMLIGRLTRANVVVPGYYVWAYYMHRFPRGENDWPQEHDDIVLVIQMRPGPEVVMLSRVEEQQLRQGLPQLRNIQWGSLIRNHLAHPTTQAEDLSIDLMEILHEAWNQWLRLVGRFPCVYCPTDLPPAWQTGDEN
jgi:hypothetical protein